MKEEYVGDDQSHRGRSHKREYDQRHQSVQPVSGRRESYSRSRYSFEQAPSRARSVSYTRHERYESNLRGHPPRKHDSPRSKRNSSLPRQRFASYRHIPAPRAREPEWVPEGHSKKIPVHFTDDDDSYFPRSRDPSKRSRASHSYQPRQPEEFHRSRQSSVSNSVEETYHNTTPSWKDHVANFASFRRSSSRNENSLAESVVSSREDEEMNAAHRRRERWAAPPPSRKEREETHIRSHGSSREGKMGTDAYEYRPKTDARLNTEDQRRQNDLDREYLSFKDRMPHTTDENGYPNYYSEDWTAEEELRRRRGEAEVRYHKYSREDSPNREHVPGEWQEFSTEQELPEEVLYGGYAANMPSWSEMNNKGKKKPEPGAWRREVWNDSDLGWSDTESYIERSKGKFTAISVVATANHLQKNPWSVYQHQTKRDTNPYTPLAHPKLVENNICLNQATMKVIIISQKTENPSPLRTMRTMKTLPLKTDQTPLAPHHTLHSARKKFNTSRIDIKALRNPDQDIMGLRMG